MMGGGLVTIKGRVEAESTDVPVYFEKKGFNIHARRQNADSNSQLGQLVGVQMKKRGWL